MRKLKICADPFPPYQYIDKDGCVKGRDYELVAGRFTKRAMKRKFVLHPGIRFILNLKAASRMFCFRRRIRRNVWKNFIYQRSFGML